MIDGTVVDTRLVGQIQGESTRRSNRVLRPVDPDMALLYHTADLAGE
jgi:hypothetical protein